MICVHWEDSFIGEIHYCRLGGDNLEYMGWISAVRPECIVHSTVTRFKQEMHTPEI